ncbi:MAG: hypothetical protein ACKVJN_09035, partial [Woeseiales bacterium]
MLAQPRYRKKVLVTLVSLVTSILLIGCASQSDRGTVANVSSTPIGPLRPPIMGRNAGVSAGHP